MTASIYITFLCFIVDIFKDMGIDWLDPANKDKTKKYSDIFVRACEHEIEFFKIGDRVGA